MSRDAACGAALMAGVERLDSATLATWMAALPHSQQQRVGQFRSQQRRRQFVAARYLLQTLIVEDTGVVAQVVAKADGAPAIAGGELHCSIAHSADSVMVAYSSQGPVGVDVERTRRRDWMKLVQAWFPEADKHHARSLSDEDGQRWFYRQWTAREAIAKAQGGGLLLASLRSPLSGLGRWRLLELALPGYQGAVVHAGPDWPQTQVADWDTSERVLRLTPLPQSGVDYRMACYESGQQP